MLHRGSLLVLLLLAGAIGCSKELPSAPDIAAPDVPISEPTAQTLCYLAGTVIAPTMVDVDRRAGELVAALDAFSVEPTQARLDDARDAWRTARKPWSNVEAFPFGLLRYPAVDADIDGWPVDIGTLGGLLEGTKPITEEFVAHQPGALKGFHTIEYLLYGEDGKKVIDEFTPRELIYLAATARAMKETTMRLLNTWKPSSSSDSSTGDWQFCNAGHPGSIYGTQEEALREIIGRLITCSSDLENRLILDANNQGEDRFSGNGKTDNLSTVEGIRAIYTGDYSQRPAPAVGLGLSELVKVKAPAIDSTIRSQLEDAALNVFVAPAVGYDPARDIVHELHKTLQTQLLPLLIMAK